MKSLELLYEYQYADDNLGGHLTEVLKEAISELEQIKSRICCENCQFFDSRVEVCYLNGCKDFQEWVLWKPEPQK